MALIQITPDFHRTGWLMKILWSYFDSMESIGMESKGNYVYRVKKPSEKIPDNDAIISIEIFLVDDTATKLEDRYKIKWVYND